MAAELTLILAPIRGITDAVYRDAWARCFGGLERAVAPFIQLRQGQPLRPGELRQVAPENNRLLPAIPQILTRHAPTFAAALRELQSSGHSEVNWNLGCPHPTVAGRGRGAGLLPHPERIDAIFGQALSNSSVRLSVKMRLGYRAPDEFAAVIEVLNRYPLAQVALHARTATQMYEGPVDVARAGLASVQCRHPFVYNGDIVTPGGFADLRRQLPRVSVWMVGRGALACPFLPGLLKGAPWPSPEVRRQRLRQFHDLLFEGYGHWLSGPGHRLDKMREQWVYLARSFAPCREVLGRIRSSGDLAEYAQAVDWAFDQTLAEPCGVAPATAAEPSAPGHRGALLRHSPEGPYHASQRCPVRPPGARDCRGSCRRGGPVGL